MLKFLYSLIVSTVFWLLLVPFALALALGLIISAITKAPSAPTASDIDDQVEAVGAALTQFISSAQERLEQGKKANQGANAQLEFVL
jgi:ABC-type polysaccharide/polyol phosphate export permease